MEITLLDDRRLQLGSRVLDAAQVSDLIDNLARLRALMQPPIGLRLDPAQEIHFVQRPPMKIAHRDGAKTLLGLLHTGLGWCWFEFDAPSAATLRDYLIKHTTAAAATGLFEDDLPGKVQ